MKKLIFTLILATICGLYAFAYDFSAVCESGQTLYYTITSSTYPYTVNVSGASLSGDLIIPSSVIYNGRTYSVTIGTSAFINSSELTSVTISNGVTSIGNYAFRNCRGLTSVTIPNSVRSIGSEAFRGCSGLVDMTIPFVGGSATATESSTSTVFGYIFGTTSYTGGAAAAQTYTSGVYITYYVPSSLRSVTVSGGELLYGAFSRCSMLTSVTIGNGVTGIGNYAFRDCSGLITVNYNATNCTTMGSSDAPVFTGCTSLATLNIGENVTNIPAYAFKGCSSLTTVNFNAINCTTMGSSNGISGNANITTLNIGENVTNIPQNAFNGCSGLSGTLTIPNSVTNIQYSAFSGCTSMTSVTISNSVTSIENYAFNNCTGLTRVNYTGTIAQWCGITFSNYYSNPLYYAHNLYINNSLVTNLVIPNTLTEIKANAFSGASCLTSLTIPNSVTSIGNYAFQNCSGQASVSIPNSVTSIGNGAFKGCSGLVDMTIPFVGGRAEATTSSDTTVLGYIFGYSTSSGTGTICQQYSSNGRIYAHIPSSLRSVTVTGGNLLRGAFYGCSMLTSVAIPNSVTSIGDYAFYRCSGLTEVTIPSTVTTIGHVAFKDCTGLTTVNFNATNCTTMGTDGGPVFSGCSSFTTLNIGENVTQIPQNAFLSCANLTTLIIPNSVTSIKKYAFYNCSGLTDIYVNRTTPPAIVATSNYSTFNNYTATLWVPCGSATAYGSAVGWRNFSDIREMLPYTLNVASADLTMGNASITQQDCIEGTAIIEAYPNDGYAFSQWNDGNTDNPRIVTVTSDATYTATFVALHTITVTSADETQGTASGSGDYAEGSQVEISATPAEHHHFTQWNDGNTDNPRTITVTSDSTFTASFAIDQHTVTVASADTEMGTVSEGGTYDYGTEIQISATPAEGYGFATWNDGNTDNPRTITVTEDITYTATFGAWRTITVLSADETMGTVSGGGVYVEGAQVEISADAVEHYHFTQWNDGNTDNPRTITVAGDTTFTASFAIDRFTITVESADEAMGTASGSNSYDYGAEIQISATASNGYHFAQWSDGNTDNPRTITVTGDATYIATFAPNNYTIVVRSLNEDWGTVSEGGTFPYGTEIQISATPRENYAFVAWTDGNTDNPRTITVVADAEYTAAFTWSVGIDETAVSEIALFPNPATDILNITSSETISEIEIVNVMGQVVKRIEVNSDNAVCDVEELKAGVYVVRIRTLRQAQGAALRKFIKE